MGRLLFVIGLLIGYGSLYPFRWSAAPPGALAAMFADTHLWTSRGDVLGNVALFVPWGIAGWLAMRGPYWRRACWVFGLGAVWALLLQILQIWVPMRSAALADVFWNSVGIVAGLACAPLFVQVRSDGEWSAARRAAVALLALWLLAYLLPLVPSLDRSLVVATLRGLLAAPVPGFAPLLLELAGGWLAARLLLAAGLGGNGGWRVFALAVVVPLVQPFLLGGQLTTAMLLGLPAGALLAVAGGRRGEPVLLVTLVIAYGCASLTPWQWLSFERTRNWLPFESLLQGDMLANSRNLVYRLGLYGGMVWLGLRAGLPRGPLIGTVAALVAGVEYAQGWQPRRSSDPWEALWVLLAGWLLVAAGVGTAPDRLPVTRRTAVVPVATRVPVATGEPSPSAPGRRFVAAVAAVVIAAIALPLALQLPGVPYNARALFTAGDVLAPVRFMLAWLTLAAGAALIARASTTTVAAACWRLPLLGAVVAVTSYALLSGSVQSLMIEKIVGAPDLYRRVVADGLWGADWQARMQLLPISSVQTAERTLRYAALVMPLIVWPAFWLALHRRRCAGLPLVVWLAAVVPVAGAWLGLCARVVYDWAITDNLVELMARHTVWGVHGGWFLSALPALVGLAAVGFVRPGRRWPYAFVLAVLSLPLGWWLFVQGLDQAVEKYGLVFPAQQFLLGPDRETRMPGQVLMLRWFALQTAWLLVTVLGMRLADSWQPLRLHRRMPDAADREPRSGVASRQQAMHAPTAARRRPLIAATVGALIVTTTLAGWWLGGGPGGQHVQPPAGAAADGPQWHPHRPRMLPGLAGWDGRGPAPGMMLRIALPEAQAVCQPGRELLNVLACWLLHGDTGTEQALFDAMRRFVPLAISEAGAYGNIWQLALAYDTAAHAPSLPPDLAAQLRRLVTGGLREMLDVLDGSSASLWHGRATLSAQALLCAAALGPPDNDTETALQRRAAQHFQRLLPALALTEAWPEGYTYWIQERALPVTLALAVWQNAQADAAGADEARRLLARIGRWHLHVVRPDFRAEPLGDEGSRVDLRHHTREILDLIAHQTGEQVFALLGAEIGRRYGAEAGYAPNFWMTILWRDPAPTTAVGWPAVLQGLEATDALFGEGALNLGFWRSAWRSDATFIAFRTGDRFTHHGRADAGHFSLFRGVPLAIDSGHYGEYFGVNRLNYAIRSIARNTIAVLRPGETVSLPQPAGPNVADGGQRVVLPTGSAIVSAEDWAAQRDEGLHLRGGRLRRYGVRPGDYAYLDADLTDAYNTPAWDSGGRGGKVERVGRELLYLPSGDRLIVHDRVRSTDAGYVKKWLLHVPERPEVEGLRVLRGTSDNGILESGAGFALERRDGGTLSLRRLLPADARLRLVGGLDYRWYVESDGDERVLDGANQAQGAPSPQPWFDRADWRIEIQPGAPRLDDEFLVVLSPAATGARDDVQALATSGPEITGAVMPEAVVVFVDRTGTGRSAAFTLPPGPVRRLYVLGLSEYATLELAAGGEHRPLRIDRNGVGTLDLDGLIAGPVRLEW